MIIQRKLLYYDAKRCMGCHACEVACKTQHNLPVGVNRVRIVTDGPTADRNQLERGFQRIACRHCAEPPCMEVCPTSAINKRGDGIVFIDQAQCNGCQLCASACPYNAIEFNPDKNWAEICDLCVERLDQGLSPFCLQHCMGGSLFFGTEDEFKKKYEEKEKNGSK
jgi:Fe-S-cluster-containing dehydrogenase component